MSLRLFSWLLYAVVGVFFGIAAVVKILDPEAFLSSLLTYEVFPYKLAVVIALFAPILELVVALSLITGVLRKGGSFLTAAMLVLFIVLVGQGLARGLELDCGCFGSNQLKETQDYIFKIGQNLILLLSLGVARFLSAKTSTNTVGKI